MPGFTTHYLFGQQAYQLIRDAGQKQAIQNFHTVFSLGLQGPDIYFYDILSHFLAKKNPGSIAHTADTGKFLAHLLKAPMIFSTGKERKIAQVYILVYIGHYLLDTACHPYVYAMTHYNSHPKGYIGQHIRLEADIDAFLLMHYQNKLPSQFHQNESIAISKEQRSVVSTLLYYAFSKTYPGLNVTKARILQAIYAMRASTKLLYDPSGRKKNLLRRLESIVPGYPVVSALIPSDTLTFHKDPCNLRHQPWRNPWDAGHASTESFLDLFESAKEDYIRLLHRMDIFFSIKNTPREEAAAIQALLSSLGSRCYHSGLSSAPYLL